MFTAVCVPTQTFRMLDKDRSGGVGVSFVHELIPWKDPGH